MRISLLKKLGVALLPLALAACDSELEQATIYRYCLGYDGIYITSAAQAGRCCEPMGIRFGRQEGGSSGGFLGIGGYGPSQSDVGDWGAASSYEKAFFETGSQIHTNTSEAGSGDFMIFHRTKEYAAYKSAGCPMPPELSGVYNLETSANALDQAEALLQRAEFLDSLCNPSLGPCFYVSDGTPTPFPSVTPTTFPSPTPTQSAATEGGRGPNLPSYNGNPKGPRVPSNTAGTGGGGAPIGGSAGGAAPMLGGGGGSTGAATDEAGKPTALQGEGASGVYAGGGRGAGGGSAGYGGGSAGGWGSGGVTSDGSAPGQVQDMGGTSPDVDALGSGDPDDYFDRLGKGDNLFKIVERRYRAKSPEFGSR